VGDADWREAILGDLREEFASRVSTHGPREARYWYCRQAVALISRRLASRLGGQHAPRRPLLPAPEPAASAGWYAGLPRDLRHAWRAAFARTGASMVIVLTLALTLAANSTIFALLDALVLRPFRFPGVERLVVVMSDSPQDPLPDGESVAPADFREWRAEVRTLRDLSAAEWWDANLSGNDMPEPVPGYRVTAGFFEALGARPVLGRTFLSEEEAAGQHRRAVLGYQLWQRRFASDPRIVGSSVRLDGEPYEVVGIAPDGFAIPDGAQVWAPLAYSMEQWNQRRRGYLRVFGHLVDGTSIVAARDELTAIVARQQREHPDTNAARPVAVVDFIKGMADPGTGPFMAITQAAGLLLMFIACANIANLLLARGGERAQEYAVRLALGASRGRLAWLTILEAGVLAAIAVFAALPLAWAGIGVCKANIPASVIRFIPGYAYIGVSARLFAVMAVGAAIAAVLASLMPALHAGHAAVAATLRQGGRSLTASRQRQWVRSALATTQIALTLALLFASGLLLTTAKRAVDGTFGFDKQNLLIGRVVLPERPYAQAERRRQFVSTVLDRLRTIPAVSQAAMVSTLPYAGGNTTREFWPEGAILNRAEVRSVDYRSSSDDYFDAMRIRLLAGRAFNSGDRGDTRALAVVSQSLVERYWPGEDPLGRRFRLSADGDWITVVGVVGDVLQDWFQQRRAPTVYRPLAQDAPFTQAFVVRTVGDPTGVAGDLRRAVATADPDQPIMDLKPMADFIVDRSSGIVFLAGMLGVVAAIAFVLAMTGVYSLMMFMASRRTQEIGVRVALGASWWHVIRVATAQAVRITVSGVALGGLLAAALGRVMESVLMGGVVSSLWQLGALAGMLTAVALTAAYLPARRAARIDPTLALRAE
jgi:putative ABC transport system permease protein